MGRPHRSGEFLADALLTDPTRRFRIWSPTNPYLGTVGDVYEEALRVAGGLRALGLGPGDVVAFQLPNWVEAAVTFYACAMLGVTLVPIVHFYGPKEVGFILRQSRARALVIVSRFGQRDYLAELATIRDGLDDLEHVIVVGDAAGDAPTASPFDHLRRAEPIDGPGAVDPDGAGAHRLHLGHHGRPQGRGAHPPHHRLRGAPARGPPGRARPGQPDRRAGRPRHRHAGRAALPAGQRAAASTSSTGGTRRPCSTPWSRRASPPAAARPTSSPACSTAPGFGPEHVELMRFIGLGGSPIPDAVAERADELGISLVRAYGCTEHPSITGSQHDDPEGEAHPHRRPAAGLGRDAHGRRGRHATSVSASPARSSPAGPTASPATPTRR